MQQICNFQKVSFCFVQVFFELYQKISDVIHLLPTKEALLAVQYFQKSISPTFDQVCAFCNIFLEPPFIDCADCSLLLCLNCFSYGTELENHKSDHSYVIVHDNIQVFPNTNWTAKEEKLLLELIVSFGYGNWHNISKAMKTRSSTECQEHYNLCYFDGIFRKLLGLTNEVYRPIRTPFLFKLNTIDPPRTDNSEVAKNMAGYRAARGEFDIPYDKSAESILTDLDGCFYGDWSEEIVHVAKTLQCAILIAYNRRLR